MEKMHSLLKRQLRRHFGDDFSIPEEWQEFVTAVNDSHWASDTDRGMLERSLELSSQELLQANSELRAVFQAIPDLMFRLDSTGTILAYETDDRTHFIVKPEELVGRRIQDVPVKAIGDEFQGAIDRVMETKSIVSIEYWMVLQDEEHCYEARLLPLLDDQIIVIIRDITVRKRAEQDLLESQEKYRTLYEESERTGEFHRKLLDASPDPVAVYDIAGVPLYLNPAFTRLFGWTLDEVKGKTIDFVPLESRPETKEHVAKVLRGEDFTDFETTRLTRAGRAIDVRLTGAIFFDMDGEPSGSVIHLRDITERKRFEEQLRQAAKMEAIGRLAGGVAHDFNNLLTVMLGYSNMVVRHLPKDNPHYNRLVQINHAAERAAALTQQLLAFSRKQVLEVRILDLNARITDMQEMLGRLMGEDLEIGLVLDPDLGKVQADPTQMEQVLMNLGVNARDAMPDGGKLTMETRNVTLDELSGRTYGDLTPGQYVMVAVSDTGEGMDEETISRVFDPFFTTKEPGKGTGLGLSTVYGIVRQHQGHITVISEPGKGATFKVLLPRAEEVGDQPAASLEPELPTRGTETILVVEDEDSVRDFACDILSMVGFTTLKAGDPEEALKICEEYEGVIHLLLTDVVLPQMDGRSLFNRLSLSRPEIRVLYISGHTDDTIVHHGVLDPDVHFLQKPFTLDKLANKVRDVLDIP